MNTLTVALKQLMLTRMFFSLELAGGSEAKGKSLRWPTPSDLNTRLRRIIAGYQRVVKKAELKKAAAEKASLNVPQKKALGVWFTSYFQNFGY